MSCLSRTKAKTAQAITTRAFLDTEMNQTSFFNLSLWMLSPFVGDARGGLPKSLICFEKKGNYEVTFLSNSIYILLKIIGKRNKQLPELRPIYSSLQYASLHFS